MNKDFEYRLGRKIRGLREACGLTQDQVAAQLQIRGCDVTRSALAKIEVGQRHIYPDELYALQQALDVPYERLFPAPSV